MFFAVGDRYGQSHYIREDTIVGVEFSPHFRDETTGEDYVRVRLNTITNDDYGRTVSAWLDLPKSSSMTKCLLEHIEARIYRAA